MEQLFPIIKPEWSREGPVPFKIKIVSVLMIYIQKVSQHKSWSSAAIVAGSASALIIYILYIRVYKLSPSDDVGGGGVLFKNEPVS